MEVKSDTFRVEMVKSIICSISFKYEDVCKVVLVNYGRGPLLLKALSTLDLNQACTRLC